jgi:RNA polymerase sigma-70 factor (ECF subfamily)
MVESLPESTSRTTLVTPELLAQLIDEHAPALELYAAQWSDSPADVVQDAFMQLIRQSPLPKHVTPWLYCVVRNRAISLARSIQRRRKYEESAAEQAQPWFAEQDETDLDAKAAQLALHSLPAEQRETIVARIWGGLSFEQIAELTGVSTSTAHRRYEAGLAALRKKLGIQWPTNHVRMKN